MNATSKRPTPSRTKSAGSKQAAATSKTAGSKKPAKTTTSSKQPAAKKLAAKKSAAPKEPPAVAPPKPASSDKSAAPRSLTVEELLARSRSVASEITDLDTSGAIEEVARHCVAAGRADLAAELARGLPAKLRGPTLLIAAGAGAGSVDAAIDVLLKSAADDPANRPLWAARAVEALAAVGTGGRAAQLAQLADAVIDEAFAGEPAWGESNRFSALVPLLRAQLASGATKSVRRSLDRWLRADPAALGEAIRGHSPLLWVAPDDPQFTLALVNAIEDFYRGLELKRDDGLRACVTWPREHLDTLLALEPDVGTELGKLLLAAGREADARRALFPEGAEEELVEYLTERHRLLGETDAAKQLVRSNERWQESDSFTRHRIELGVESVAEARERLRKLDPRTGGSVTAGVSNLISLAHLALARGEHAELDPILSAIDRLFASPKRTHHDHRAEWTERCSLSDLHAAITAVRGDPAALAAQLWADLEDLPRLQKYARDQSHKNGIVTSLVRRASRHGQPQLALKAARKISAAHQGSVAREVALAFLPADPGGALAALDTLAKDKADSILLARPWDGSAHGRRLLPLLWAAVLPLPAERQAA